MDVRFNHIGITVSDLDKSIEFYRTLFGLDPGLYVDIISKSSGKDDPQILSQRVAFVPIGESGLIELHEFVPGRKAPQSQFEDVGYAYLCFEVDDLEAIYEKLRVGGAKFMAPLRQLFVESNDDAGPESREAPMYQKVCDVFDPDGKRVELVENDERLKTPAINRAAQSGLAVRDQPYVVRV